MEKEQIVKALELCANNGDCKDCPINPHVGNYGYCTSIAINRALSLIREQEKRIEEVKAAFPGMDVLAGNLSLGICCHTGEGALGVGISCRPCR